MYLSNGRKIFSIARRFLSDLSRRELDFFLDKVDLMEIEKGAFFTPTVSSLPRTFWRNYNKFVGGNR
jgi:hypothetical protein